MKPTWLIERNVYGQDAADVKVQIQRQGMQCCEVDYAPGRQPPDDIVGCPPLADDACVILWGTLPLMRQVQLRRRWIPGGWCDTANLDCASYYAHLGRYLLNRYYTLLPGVEAIRLQDELFAEFGPDDEVFIRPSGAQKLFTGVVAYRDDFARAVAPSRYDPTTLVVVSTPKEINREWRLVIAGDEIVAASQYRDHGAISVSRGCPDEVTEFAESMLRDIRWRPAPVFMLDLCESMGSLHLLELNSFSCSAWYASDPAAVIRAASGIAEREWSAKRER
jgi:hypothetical protein